MAVAARQPRLIHLQHLQCFTYILRGSISKIKSSRLNEPSLSQIIKRNLITLIRLIHVLRLNCHCMQACRTKSAVYLNYVTNFTCRQLFTANLQVSAQLCLKSCSRHRRDNMLKSTPLCALDENALQLNQTISILPGKARHFPLHYQGAQPHYL